MAHSTNDESEDRPEERAADAQTPTWAKVFGVVTLIVVLLFVIMLVTGGHHGPGQHVMESGRVDAVDPR